MMFDGHHECLQKTTIFSSMLHILSQLICNVSCTFSCCLGNQGGGGGLPYPFLKIEKKSRDFRKKGPNCVHPWVESSIQNVVLRVSRRKSSKIFPCWAFFLQFSMKNLSKCPNSTKPALKNFWLLASQGSQIFILYCLYRPFSCLHFSL